MEERSEKHIREEDVQERHLPDEVIIQHILPCLPIKPLTKFKVVSKLWYSSISSPNFILKHTKQPLFCQSYSPVETVFVNYGKSYYLYSLENDDNVANYSETNNLVELNPNFELEAGDKVEFVGSSNGLICLVDADSTVGKYFILWNPTANESHRYYYHEDLDIFRYPRAARWGMGYVSSLEDFKVVRLVRYNILCKLSHTVDVFSLRSNTWRNIDIIEDDFYNCTFTAETPKLIDETLYFTKFSRKYGWHCVCFDLAAETFYVNSLFIPSELSVVGGCIWNFRRNSDGELVIDIVKHPGSMNNSGHLLSDLGLEGLRDLVGYTKTGKMVVAYPFGLGLVDVVDPKSKKSLVTFQAQEFGCIERYVPSQISPLPRAESGVLPNASDQAA